MANPTPKTHHATLALVPPEAVWAPIQAIRREHDRQFSRWMPHVNLLYPFAPPDALERLAPAIGGACAMLAPFEITLSRFELFDHGGHFTLWVVPEPGEPLQQLHAFMLVAAPGYEDTMRFANGFTPHLSVGQAAGRAEAERLRAALQASWQPLTFTMDAVYALLRGDPPDDTFRIAGRFPLGNPS